MSAPKTLSPGTLNVTLTGLINAYGSVATYQIYNNGAPTPTTIDAAVFGHSGAHFTIHSTGTILSKGTTEFDGGIVLGASGTIFNTGTIIAGSGIAIFGTSGKSSISNTGKIIGSLGIGLVADDFANVTNSKYIFGHGYGLELAAGANVQNLAKSTIASASAVAIASKLFATVTNAGTLRGENGGIFLQSGGTVNNTGLILQTNSNSTAAALESYQAATFTNAGLIEGGNGIKLLVNSPTSPVYITNTGTIDVTSTTAVNAHWYNGFLTYGVGIYSNASGEVVNSKLIEGNHIGVAFEHVTGTVLNTGLISASVGYGIYLNGGGIIANTGTIYGYDQGMFVGPGPAPDYVTNSGYIEALKPPAPLASGNTYIGGGIVVFGAGTVVNTGTVSDPGGGGIQLFAEDGSPGLPGTVINSGTVKGLYGVQFYGAGGVYNTGNITGQDIGVFVTSPAGQITNSGLIAATGTTFNYSTIATNTYTATGVLLKSGGTITNTSTGTILATGGDAIRVYGSPGYVLNDGLISAAKIGILLGAGGTIIDTGTITGATYAISFATGYSNLLVIDAASDITGSVNGGGGTLEFAADGAVIGTITTSLVSQFNNFDTLIIGPNAIWNSGNTTTLADPTGLTNDGTLIISATAKLTIENALTGTGTVDLSKKTLTLNGSVASTQKISFTGTGEALDLGDPKKFGAKIEKFALGDTIDLTSISLSAITATHFTAGVLTLAEGSTKLLFTFASPASFGSDTFALTAAGHGTAITLAPPAAILPLTPPATLAPLPTLA